jgi:hypothetical protein
VQQRVLRLLLSGVSLYQCSATGHLDRRTVRRWWHWLKARSETFALFLRSRFPDGGRAVDGSSFWLTCLDHMPLCEAMAYLDQEGIVVP